MLTKPKKNDIDSVDWSALAEDVLKAAAKSGATAAEVSASTESGFSVSVRMGEVETVEYNRDKGFGITVYFGQRKGSASTSDTSLEAVHAALEAACAIAEVTGSDPSAGLADKALMATHYPELDLYHPWNLTAEQGIELALECESQARAQDKRITNSEGCSLATHQGSYVYANSHGFLGAYSTTRHSCALVGLDGSNMQRDYSYTVARDPEDLHSVAMVAREAAERTVRRLGARRLSTRRAPVIFEAEIARGLLGAFVGAIRGSNLYREASFLLNHLGKKVFPDSVRIYQQPHLLKGLGSAPFDAEGVVTAPRDFVRDGLLESYVLSSYSARKLGMETTGNAGGVHNLFINTGNQDLAGLLRQMDTGLFVTEVMGQGVNLVTGDYSRGVAGFWVEKGVIQYPVEEITIAGNLRDMLLNLVAVANDIDARGNIQTGSILLDEMMIGGA
jgi:PmbA protein